MGDILFDGERKGQLSPLYLSFPRLDWQKEIAVKLNIPEVRSHGCIAPLVPISPESVPDRSSLFSPNADGNCGFRALSFLVSGTEEYHRELRNGICDVIATKDAEWIQRWTGRNLPENGVQYLDRTSMRRHEWMGEIELQAAAELLNCHVIVYRNMWHRYNPDYSLGDLKVHEVEKKSKRKKPKKIFCIFNV
ncbi:hypothetical protein QR680_012763 [Steinernema hermaphroditum]|uniref:OTU domain-containing protein n=1 Tax=Steinernema hermaphroditum TaxID=289476 RepID=A0AA39M135_9BILA|nr:hypothetical protein QR680_012763 [Steinernema hermaphroditum]